MDKRWMTFQHCLFQNLDCSRKLYFYLINLAGGKELMLQECRDWRQETSRTVIIKTDFYEEKEG
jgi:hypothetical protein